MALLMVKCKQNYLVDKQYIIIISCTRPLTCFIFAQFRLVLVREVAWDCLLLGLFRGAQCAHSVASQTVK